MRTTFILFFCMCLASCAQTVGEVSVMNYMPAAKNSEANIASPLTKASLLREKEGLIYRNINPSNKKQEEIFSIYLTDAYIKYMQDMWGLNELLFIFEFTEVNEGSNSDTVTKILGPFEGVADGTFAPLKNKLIYGPKLMQSDVVSMKVTVLEFDADENEENTSILDFIQSSTQSLKLANPLTASQLQLTAELSKTILQKNSDDIVMSIELDMVAGNKSYDSYDSHAQVIPLEAGQKLFVKREACRIFLCFDYLTTKNGSTFNEFGMLADALYSPIVFANRTFLDTPDNDSLKVFDFDEFNERLAATDSSTLKLSEYREKSWLLFNIVKGGDDSLWEKRKILKEAEKALLELVARESSFTNEDANELDSKFQNVIENIKRAELQKNMNGLTLIPNKLVDGLYEIDIDASKAEFCLAQDENSKFTSLNLSDNNYKITKNSQSMSLLPAPNIACFDLSNSDGSLVTKKNVLLTLFPTFTDKDFSATSIAIPLKLNPN
ncbi:MULTISPECIES: hypothetical protein [unclassified Alteromonas]|uniref:hypothetical protein n=1 Tax=unclassified Alteromonas TaxID=2614992 RepID=UPI001EF34083|nr:MULTISPECIES: hypothetical protein [unclassified Alteromonas]MCG7638105.1 hypothetical protein [Alteromonas sp. CNT1-28]MCG7813734.1 hypothetical protein [Alteromonas sp. MCA-1]